MLLEVRVVCLDRQWPAGRIDRARGDERALEAFCARVRSLLGTAGVAGGVAPGPPGYLWTENAYAAFSRWVAA